jgi:hypothetical protein
MGWVFVDDLVVLEIIDIKWVEIFQNFGEKKNDN